MKPIAVGKTRKIGTGQPCFLVAEIGINHNGDMDLAHREIDAASASGADGVKFQNYHTEGFVSDRSLTYEYISQGETVVESQYDMFKRCELRPESLRELRQHCEERGVVFFSTPMDEEGVAELVREGVTLLKNGSDCLGHLPLIRCMARTGLPTVISTGMATREDIDDAVQAFRDAGGRDLILLHCTSAYPTPAADVNLRKIPALAEAYDCLVGFSDHTDGIVAAVGAVTLGACFIEKHFTLDKNLPGPDHRFSADPGEFRALVDAVRFLEMAMGTAEVGFTPSEAVNRRGARLSCAARHDLSAGHILLLEDIAFQRPGTGLPPKMIAELVGKQLTRDVRSGSLFEVADLDSEKVYRELTQ
jgi:N-acetylneuraminate synthase/N,N'-diacetyllegionaminate synthase